MGKFDGVLIASDYDNTMVYTEGMLRRGGEMPAISRENREAVEYFMAEGGTFSVATGRALPSFDKVRHGVPMNGPTILFNGGAIYDFAQRRYLHTAWLGEEIRGHLRALMDYMPDATFEIYHDNNDIHAINPNELTAAHEHLTHSPTVVLSSIEEIPSPIGKLLFEEHAPRLKKIMDWLLAQPWSDQYEIVPSSTFLLELTARGADKGGAVRRLAELTGTFTESSLSVRRIVLSDGTLRAFVCFCRTKTADIRSALPQFPAATWRPLQAATNWVTLYLPLSWLKPKAPT